MTHFGETLRRLRLQRDVKQAHLADLMGVTQATVSRWERGLLALSEAQKSTAIRLLAVRPAPQQDAALRRLVETSTARVHLICDRTHRLLAASPSRKAEWRGDPSAFLGRSLLNYASAEILQAEARLGDMGWRDGDLSSLVVDTGPNAHPDLAIPAGRMLWERIALADGSIGRLVTTLA